MKENTASCTKMAAKVSILLGTVMVCTLTKATSNDMIDFTANGAFQSGIMTYRSLVDSFIGLQCSLSVGHLTYEGFVCEITKMNDGPENVMVTGEVSSDQSSVFVMMTFQQTNEGYYTCLCSKNFSANSKRLTLQRTIQLVAMNNHGENCFANTGSKVVAGMQLLHHCFDGDSKLTKTSVPYDMARDGVAQLTCPSGKCSSQVIAVSEPSISLSPSKFSLSQEGSNASFVCTVDPPSPHIHWTINDKNIDEYASASGLEFNIKITQTSKSSTITINKPKNQDDELICVSCDGGIQGNERMEEEEVVKACIGDEGMSSSQEASGGGMDEMILVVMASCLGFIAVLTLICIILYSKCLCNTRQELKNEIENRKTKTSSVKQKKNSPKKEIPYAISQRISIFAMSSSDSLGNDAVTIVPPGESKPQPASRECCNDVLTLDHLGEGGEISVNSAYETCVPSSMHF